MKLSEAECAAFDREGYLFRPGMFSPVAVMSCSSWSFHCTRTACFCASVRSRDDSRTSGDPKVRPGFFMAPSKFMTRS